MKSRELIRTITDISKKLKNTKLKELELRGIEGLAPSHGDILVNLFKHGDLSMRELAERIQKDKSTITALVNKLVKLGYVEKYKNGSDSRINIVRLTEMAHERRESFIEVSNIITEKISRHVTDEEIEKALEVLGKINDGF